MTTFVKNESDFLSKLSVNSYSIERQDGSLLGWDVPLLWKMTENEKPIQRSLSEFSDIIKRWIKYGGTENDKGQFIVPFDINHFERIRSADLDYPILTITDPLVHHNLRVADGMHRLMKCYLANITTIRTVNIKHMPPPTIAMLKDNKPQTVKIKSRLSNGW